MAIKLSPIRVQKQVISHQLKISEISQMKIVLANNFYYLRGGSERVLFEEKRILEENGHQVIPFSRTHPKNEWSDYTDFFLPEANHELEKLSLLKKSHIALKVVYNRDAGKRFDQLIEETQPDLVHAHNIYGGLTTSVLDVAKSKNVPAVMTLHDTKLICPSYLSLNHGIVCEACRGQRFYHCLFNRCHKDSLIASGIYMVESYYNKWLKKYDSLRFLICPSKFLCDKLLVNGISAERLVYLPNFVNVADFKPAFEVGDYLLYVGRLSKEKGILTLLKAVKKVNVPVKIVGDGPLKSGYEAFTKDNDMSHVTFEGYKSGQELREIFQGSAFLVVPSEWYENSPMTILEAFAYGKPVIGSKMGGIPEMIEPGQTGLLFEAGNPDQLSERIRTLWSDSSMILKMGRNGRRKVEAEFSSKVHYEKLIETYTKAIR